MSTLLPAFEAGEPDGPKVDKAKALFMKEWPNMGEETAREYAIDLIYTPTASISRISFSIINHDKVVGEKGMQEVISKVFKVHNAIKA